MTLAFLLALLLMVIVIGFGFVQVMRPTALPVDLEPPPTIIITFECTVCGTRRIDEIAGGIEVTNRRYAFLDSEIYPAAGDGFTTCRHVGHVWERV